MGSEMCIRDRPITPEQAETSQTLAQELGISPILGQLLVQRGITKAADAKKAAKMAASENKEKEITE